MLYMNNFYILKVRPLVKGCGKMNENNKASYRGMVLDDHSDYFTVSLTGEDRLFRLYKSDELCLSIFEPLTRFEFEADCIDAERLTITEIVRFDNSLKIKHKSKILKLITHVMDGLQLGHLHTSSFYELQNLLKGEHISFNLYGFNQVRDLFWRTDLIHKLDELQESEPGQVREDMIIALNKRDFLIDQHPDQKKRLHEILDSFTAPAKEKSLNKNNRVLVAEHEAPNIGDLVEFPFLKQLGVVKIINIGKSFKLTDTIKTVGNATKKRLEGQIVCWVYYEPTEPQNALSQSKKSDLDDDKYRLRSIDEVDKYLERIRKQFEIDGIKPRNSTAYIADFRSGTDICDMRPLNKPYWFVIASGNIWYINNAPSTAIMHHNLHILGVDCVGYVLTKSAYPDIVNSLNFANKSIQEIRVKMNSTRF